MVDAAHALPDDDRRSEPPAPQQQRQNWLDGSGQGAGDERPAAGADAPPEGLRLTTSNDLSTAVPVDRPKVPVRPAPGQNREVDKPRGPVAWPAAASSVPKLKVDATATAAGAPGAGGRVAAARIEPIRPSEAPEASRRTASSSQFRDDQDEAVEDDFTEFPEDTGPAGPVLVARPRKLEEPLWVIALDALRSNRRIQLIALATVLVPLLTWTLWPRSEPGISLSALRREPTRWDGQVVRLSGRVGEVFQVGAGWAFNLHQGRDTIVVFKVGTAPRTRDRISIAGSVSTGYLDGHPRQAIFAQPESR
ncbi:MAG: hypothetical protein ABIS67_01985 [Candidatus Eisenbacteria bacterium]